jgi:hypothetical protein
MTTSTADPDDGGGLAQRYSDGAAGYAYNSYGQQSKMTFLTPR